MKFSVSIFTAVLLFTAVITGCKKDKDDPKANAVQIGDTTIGIFSGALINYGTSFNHDGYNLDLDLLGEEVTITETSPGSRDISGPGLRVYFEIFTENDSILTSGHYVYNDTSSIKPVESFDYSYYVLNNDDNDRTYITSGSVDVNRSGNNYELIFTLRDENEKELTGYYKGPLQLFQANAGK